MKKKAVTIILSMMMMVSLAACGSSSGNESSDGKTANNDSQSQEDSLENITLNVGCNGGYYPICFLNDDTGELDGYEIDVLSEIGERTGIQMNFEVAKMQGIFGMLDTGKIDTIASQLSITDERLEKYDFTDPYLYTPIGFAVQEGKEDSIQKVEDIEGKRVGVNTGAMAYETLSSYEDKIDFELVPYDGAGMEQDLSLGRIDALFQSQLTSLSVKEQGEYDIALADCEPLRYETNAYAFLKGSETGEKVIEPMNEAIASMREDGTLKEFSEKWFGIDATEKSDD